MRTLGTFVAIYMQQSILLNLMMNAALCHVMRQLAAPPPLSIRTQCQSE